MNDVDVFIGVLALTIMFVVIAIIITFVIEIVADAICSRKMDTEYPIGYEPKGEE